MGRNFEDEVIEAILEIGKFLRAIPDYQLGMMTFGQRITIEKFLTEQAQRFRISDEALV